MNGKIVKRFGVLGMIAALLPGVWADAAVSFSGTGDIGVISARAREILEKEGILAKEGKKPLAAKRIPAGFRFIPGTNKGYAVGLVEYLGSAYMATRDGLYRKSGSGWEYVPNSGIGRPVTGAAIVGGKLIVVTRDGLYRYTGGGLAFIEGSNRGIGHTVGAAQYRGEMILATSEGLYRHAGDGWSYMEDSGRGRPLTGVAVIDGELIAVARDGLYRDTRDGWQFVSGTNKGRAVGALKFGNDVLLATEDGLYRQAGSEWEYVADSGKGRPVTSVAEIEENLIVVARDGLYTGEY